LIAKVSLKARHDADEAHPQFGVLLAVTLFGYATRMAQANHAPLPSEEVAQTEQWVIRHAQGTIDHEAMGYKPDALHELAKHAAALADDRNWSPHASPDAPRGLDSLQPLATKQLHRNLRQNGVKRRLHPPPDAIENLIRLGCAVRIIEEAVGDSPVLKSDLGYDGAIEQNE
jgi:hypothetical protein